MNNIESLIIKYNKLIYRICYNILQSDLDAQDLTQEVYISLYTSIDKYISLPENEQKNIICKIALNKCRDYLRNKEMKLQYDDVQVDNEDNSNNIFINNTNIEEAICNKEKKLFIAKMINELKPPYSTILFSYYIQEKSLDAISNELKIPKTTLKVQIYRAKLLLKEKLTKGGVCFYE